MDRHSTSLPSQSTSYQTHLQQGTSHPTSHNNSTHSFHDDSPPRPDLPIHLHVPPPSHGPPKLKPLPPVFVRSTRVYDDFGRLKLEDVEENGGGKGKEKERGGGGIWEEVGWEDGRGVKEQGVGDKGLSSSATSATSILHSSTSSQPDPSSQPSTSTSTSQPHPQPQPKIPPSQWFIRRALLSQSQAQQHPSPESPTTQAINTNDELSVVPVPSPINLTPQISRSSSIVSLIDLPPPPSRSRIRGEEDLKDIAYKPPTWYHIPSDNVGYRMMVKGGWEGGGLGGGGGGGRGGEEGGSNVVKKMVKREMVKNEIKEENREEVQIQEEGNRRGQSSQQPIEISDSDSSSESDFEIEENPTPLFSSDILLNPSLTHSSSGPGRTAPVPTILKTNLHGIGHRPPTHRSSTTTSTTKGGIQKKRVTHTPSELRAIKRGKVVDLDGGVEIGRKKLVRESKREGRERRKLRALLDT